MLPYTLWSKLPLSTRVKISTQFGVSKVRSTHVSDNKVVDDGYNIHEIENALNIPAMQAYLDSDETDFFKLFEMTVDKIEGRLPVVSENQPIVPETEKEMIEESKPNKKISKKK